MKYGGLDDHYSPGTYLCASCDSELYESTTKFDCGCGWPGFWTSIPGSVRGISDHDGTRTEIVCLNCSAHLGHVQRGEGACMRCAHCALPVADRMVPAGFNNPPPNERHCVNSSALSFRPQSDPEMIERSRYTGPVYMRSGRRVPTERSRFTQLEGGQRPSTQDPAEDASRVWVCFNTELHEYVHPKGTTYEALRQHFVGALGLSTDAEVMLKLHDDGEETLMPLQGNMRELPEEATYFDLEHIGSQKKGNSDKLPEPP